jgi:hypothetical protein
LKRSFLNGYMTLSFWFISINKILKVLIKVRWKLLLYPWIFVCKSCTFLAPSAARVFTIVQKRL